MVSLGCAMSKKDQQGVISGKKEKVASLKSFWKGTEESLYLR